MKSSEIAGFAGKFGHKPTKVAVAIDALAVFVHKDNPIKGLDFKQVDAIFSKTRKRGGCAVASAPMALIGPGTGLGVSGLVPDGQGGWLPLAGEGGHVSLAAQTDLEAQVIQQLARRYEGHVSAERVLSGPGLVALHQALAALRGMTADPDITPAHITQAALQAHDPLSLQTLETFSAFLGTVAGDLALTLGARGGVYLGGGILPHWRGWLAQSPFRARFEAKGRYRDYMAAIPVWWIDAPTSPALLGAARALTLQAI